ncbi:hypothetical protein O6W90_21260, partial [Salmonella enterica subsp. enterica]
DVPSRRCIRRRGDGGDGQHRAALPAGADHAGAARGAGGVSVFFVIISRPVVVPFIFFPTLSPLTVLLVGDAACNRLR